MYDEFCMQGHFDNESLCNARLCSILCSICIHTYDSNLAKLKRWILQAEHLLTSTNLTFQSLEWPNCHVCTHMMHLIYLSGSIDMLAQLLNDSCSFDLPLECGSHIHSSPSPLRSNGWCSTMPQSTTHMHAHSKIIHWSRCMSHVTRNSHILRTFTSMQNQAHKRRFIS